MKLLFTIVGRRVELITQFKSSALKLGIDLIIYGADIDPTAPALMFCNKKVFTPKIYDPNYIDFLIDYCTVNEIDALIPTIDTDLSLLSKNKHKFRQTKVFISSEEKIALSKDKRLTADYFTSLGLKTPKTVSDYRLYNMDFPAFIKPKDGSSSIYAYKADSESELKSYVQQVPDYIIQPFISGTEYTIDIFCDYQGNPIYITPRIRLAVRAGEVLKTKICQDHTIIEDMKILINDFKPCGPITVQMIKHETSGEKFYIEINPRFGGGAPLSMYAGANSAEMLLKMLTGEAIKYIPQAAEDGAVFSRFDQSIRVN